MKKRILSLVLALSMLCAFVPCVHAAEIVNSGTCGADGDNLTWALDDDGTLTISGTGDMEDYSSSYSIPWYSNRSSIVSVVIENGVTSIGEDVFEDCTGLTSVTIPDGVTSIGGWAFYGCSGLTSVTIPDGVTSIGISSFYGCIGLTNITVPDSVTSIGIVKEGSRNRIKSRFLRQYQTML